MTLIKRTLPNQIDEDEQEIIKDEADNIAGIIVQVFAALVVVGILIWVAYHFCK